MTVLILSGLSASCVTPAEEHFDRGEDYLGEQQWDEAIAEFTKAIGLDHNFFVAYYSRGATYNKIGEYDKAIADFTKAIELKPNHAWSYAGRGLAYEEKGEYVRSITDLTKAIELSDSPELTQVLKDKLQEIRGR